LRKAYQAKFKLSFLSTCSTSDEEIIEDTSFSILATFSVIGHSYSVKHCVFAHCTTYTFLPRINIDRLLTVASKNMPGNTLS